MLPRLFLLGALPFTLLGCGPQSGHDEGSAAGGASSGGAATVSTGGSSALGGGNSISGAATTGSMPENSGSNVPESPTATSGAGDSMSSGAGASTGGDPSAGGVSDDTSSGMSGGTAAESGSMASGGSSIGGMIASGGSSLGGMTASGGTTASGGALPAGGTSSGGMSDTGGDANTAGTAGSSSAGSTFHVFLLLGQSNMAGYPKAQDADREEDPRVTVLGFDDCAATGRKTDEWDVAAPPLHECWNDAIGPGDYFAKTLIDIVPAGDTIGLVPCAISGEKIETFMKVGGTKYDWIVQRARLAQDAGGVIDGILFHQGESNSGDSSWPGKVNTFITDLRNDLGIGDVPFLAGELLYTGGTSGHNTLVNQLPSVVSNAYVISAEGLVVDPADTQWNLHFDHDSQVEFGKRYAATMIDALAW